jgi:hypothetical protein
MNWETAGAVASAAIAAAALLTVWLSAREAELRRDDVLAWANEVIEALQGMVLVCILAETTMGKDAKQIKAIEIAFQTSTLVECGRLFFKNRRSGDFGEEKPEAYRGLRPMVLDPIVVTHQIACAWPPLNELDRAKLLLLAEDAERKFVSLIQREVGRSRTAAAYTKRSGDGAQLKHLIRDLDEVRLRRALAQLA